MAVSIHAPPGGRDDSAGHTEILAKAFQSTRPLGGATSDHNNTGRRSWLFQSTRPLGGATCRLRPGVTGRARFNPRAPWGARRDRETDMDAVVQVSIHAPPGGRDAQVAR